MFLSIDVIQPALKTARVSALVFKNVAVEQKLLSPGSFSDAQAGLHNFLNAFKTGKWRQVTVGEAMYLVGQTSTVAGFFFLGEILGRGNLTGYNVG